MGWTGFDWTTSASGQEQVEVDVDQISYLNGTYVMGSRPVEDHTLEHEEHCQEQEDSLYKKIFESSFAPSVNCLNDHETTVF